MDLIDPNNKGFLLFLLLCVLLNTSQACKKKLSHEISQKIQEAKQQNRVGQEEPLIINI